jgi:hypothetical protein
VGIDPQLMATNGALRRGERVWIAAAVNSLPVPDSPAMKTGASVAATLRIRCPFYQPIMLATNSAVDSAIREISPG